MKFLFPEVALYLYKSTICPCMEYCCHVWAGAPSCYLELLDKLQKRIRRTFGPPLAASLELNPWLIVKMWPAKVFSIGITLVDVLQNWLNWFHFPFSTRCSERLHDFSVAIPRCYKDVYDNSFFPRTGRLWNSLSIECFPLTYHLSCFQSRITDVF